MVTHCLVWFLFIFHSLNGLNDFCDKETSSCEQASRNSPILEQVQRTTPVVSRDWSAEYMVVVNGSTHAVGTDSPVFESDGESPKRSIRLNSYFIDVFEVSNQNFAKFVKETNYVTEAEKFGNSFVLDSLIKDPEIILQIKNSVAAAPWWVQVDGASWKSPEGPNSDISDRMDHPVVHVSWNDADNYCKWIGKRLPSEVEWEVACRGGLQDRLFPWGNQWKPNNEFRANTWQGKFPEHDSGDDGYQGTAPVSSFPPNKYGLKNMVGNVWEWTSDWWSTDHINLSKKTKNNSNKVKKGGSFMCSKEFCYRQRCAARSFNTPDSSASNLGFRCAADFKDAAS